MRTARTVLLVLLAAITLRCYLLYSVLPQSVPSHFDAVGRPDGWSSPGPFLLLIGGLAFFMASTFLGTVWLVRRLPDSLINLPHKEFWLAPDRRGSTLDDLEARLLWMGVVSTLLAAVILELSAWVALSGAERLPGWAFPVLVGSYLLVIALQTAALIRAYSKPPEASR